MQRYLPGRPLLAEFGPAGGAVGAIAFNASRSLKRAMILYLLASLGRKPFSGEMSAKFIAHSSDCPAGSAG